jgi:uncharacterized protein
LSGVFAAGQGFCRIDWDNQMNKVSDIFHREDVISLLRQQMVQSRFGIQSLSLFGSVARNEATATSDLDFVVDFEGVVTFDRYMDLKIFLEDLFNKKIDLAIEGSLKPQIRQRVFEEAILIPRGDISDVS